MTAPATVATLSCPKCGSEMYDNRLTKKNPKQPDWKCKRYKEGCEGVIWPAKSASPKPPAVKTQLPQARSLGTPEFLPTEGEEQAELQKKIGFDIGAIQKELALYQSLTEWVNTTIAPIYQKSGVGMSPESAVAATATLFISTAGKK